MTGEAIEKGTLRAESGKSDEVVFSVKNISKKFCKRLKRSMFYGILDLARNLVGIRPDSTTLRKGEFWAADDICFELRRGQVLGIVGANGSGKTTLLRLIAAIFPPDKGEIRIRGRVAALISLGAGFHPYMTGRENIYLNGAILGMGRKEIDRKLESIIDFAELGDFIDSPVTTYSTGMKVRLGFSIAISIKPDVLLLDEVLAVGDSGFKAKCYSEIDRLSRKTAIVFVSHHLNKIARICTDIIVLDRGRKVYQSDDVAAGIEFYCSQFDYEKASISGEGIALIDKVRLLSDSGLSSDKGMLRINYLESLSLEITFSLDKSIQKASVNIVFVDKDFNNVSICRSELCGFEIKNSSPENKIRVKFPELQLSPGIYYVTVGIKDEVRNKALIKYHAIERFRVMGGFTSLAPFHLKAHWDDI